MHIKHQKTEDVGLCCPRWLEQAVNNVFLLQAVSPRLCGLRARGHHSRATFNSAGGDTSEPILLKRSSPDRDTTLC